MKQDSASPSIQPNAAVGRPSETRPEDRVPLSQKIAFSLGYFPHQTGWYALSAWAKLILPIVYGMSPVSLASGLGLMRLWDAFIDPTMGRITDNSRLKMGRRRPYIIIGAIGIGIVFPLLWTISPNWSDGAKWAYFLGVTLLFYTVYTVFSVPFLALKYELTPDYTERTRVAAVIAYSGKAFSLLVPWYFPLTQSGIFGEPVPSTRIAGVLIGILLATFGIIAGVFSRERYRKVAVSQSKIKIGDSLKAFGSDPAFWKLKGIMAGVMLNNLLIDLVDTYLGIYYVWGGQVLKGATIQAVAANLTQGLGVLTVAIISRYLAHLDKLTLIKAGLLLAMFGTFTKWFMLNPEYPYLSLFVSVYMSPAYAAFWLCYAGMQPDYMDHDELKCSKRREGLYAAASGWIMKCGISLATIAAGGILWLSGFEIGAEADQPAGVFFKMRILIIALPFTMLAVAYYCAHTYPLTQSRLRQIRLELEARRGAV